MLTYLSGSIWASPAQTLVKTVNVVGAMGKGIALEFKRDYPEMYRRYRELCEAKEFKIGMLWLYISFPQLGTEHGGWIGKYRCALSWRNI